MEKPRKKTAKKLLLTKKFKNMKKFVITIILAALAASSFAFTEPTYEIRSHIRGGKWVGHGENRYRGYGDVRTRETNSNSNEKYVFERWCLGRGINECPPIPYIALMPSESTIQTIIQIIENRIDMGETDGHFATTEGIFWTFSNGNIIADEETGESLYEYDIVITDEIPAFYIGQ